MKTKDNDYTINEDALELEEDIKNDDKDFQRRITWTQVIIGVIAFLIIFFSFFYFFEGKPYRVVDQWTKNMCEASNPEEYKDIKEELGSIIKKNGYEYDKVCFIYYPETDFEPSEIRVFFRVPKGEWYFFKDGMTYKWIIPNNIKKKISEL